MVQENSKANGAAMQKQTIAFAVETDKQGIVTRIGRSEISQPPVMKKSSPAAAKKEDVKKESM